MEKTKPDQTFFTLRAWTDKKVEHELVKIFLSEVERMPADSSSSLQDFEII